jgi:hypothetical protein
MRIIKHWLIVLSAFMLALVCGFISPLSVIAFARWGAQLPSSAATLWLPPYALTLVIAVLWWKRCAPRPPFVEALVVVAFMTGPLLGLVLSVPFACALANDCF